MQIFSVSSIKKKTTIKIIPQFKNTQFDDFVQGHKLARFQGIADHGCRETIQMESVGNRVPEEPCTVSQLSCVIHKFLAKFNKYMYRCGKLTCMQKPFYLYII